MLRLIAISHPGCVIDRFGDANGFKFMVRNGEQNFAEIIIPIRKSFLQIFWCASPKLDSPVFSTTSLVFLPTKIFEIKI